MNLDKLMKDRHVTNAVIARELHTTAATVSRWRNGVNNPDIECLPKLCEILGCSLDDLLTQNANPPLTPAATQGTKIPA